MTSWEPEYVRFVETSSPQLLRTGYLLASGDAHLAEDLVQSALLATYRGWPRLRHVAAANGYARAALLNAYRDHFRRSWSRERPIPAVPDTPVEPDARLQSRTDILRGLALLPPRQRAVVVCRYFEDLDESRTADVLGCSVGTVKSQCHAALRRLRELPQFAEYGRTVR